MGRHIFLLALLLPGVAGCSSMRGLLAFGDAAPAETQVIAAPAATPADAPRLPVDWCQRVAAQARSTAAASGFDAATQERLAAQNLRQCMAMDTSG